MFHVEHCEDGECNYDDGEEFERNCERAFQFLGRQKMSISSNVPNASIDSAA